MSDEKPKLGISRHFPSLVRLSEIVDTTTDILKQCLQQLSKGGISKDQIILESMERPPFLDILGLLESLQQEMAARQMLKDTVVEPLGLRDKQIVKHSMDLFILFEIMPRLLPGLGTKLEHRMERSEVAGFLRQLQSRQGFDWQPNWGQMDLGQIVRRMVQIIDKADLLAGIMRDKYTTDILASLLQTAYAPIPPSSNKTALKNMRESKYYVEMDEGKRIELRQIFSRFYDSTNTHQLLESLTTLLNNVVVGNQNRFRWMEILCGRFLSRVVAQRSHGARITVDYLVANDEDLTAAKMDRISNMLLSAPGGMAIDEYLAKIVPQIIKMAVPQKTEGDVVDSVMDKQAVEERVEQVAVYALKQLADQNPRRFGELVAEPANEPLMRWFQIREAVDIKDKAPLIQDITEPIATADDDNGGGVEVASAMDLKHALGFIERLVLTGGGIPSSTLLEELVVPVFAPLLSWFAAKDASREAIQDILVTTLRLLPLSDTISAVIQTICSVRGNKDSECPVFEASRLVWQKGESGTVDVEALLDILSSHKLAGIIGDIFMALLQKQQISLEQFQNLRHQDNDGLESVETQLGQWWLLSQTTLAMTERFGAKVLTKQVDVLVFVLGALQRANEAIKEQTEEVSIEELIKPDKEDTDTGTGESEMAVLALMMLSQMMAASEQQAFTGLMSGQHSSDKVEWGSQSLELLRRIRDIIRELQKHRLDTAMKELMDELSPQIVLVLALQGDKTALNMMDEAPAEDSPLSRFETALHDTRNELVPVQAHGLIELRRLVLDKSPVLDNPERMDAIIHAFVNNVKHQDSYVYLNAIRGLSSLADAEGRRFVPMLMEMYQKPLELDEWLRVGEALLQSVMRAGLMLGEYADMVVPPLINVVRENKDAEELSGVQAHSALSILGAIAQTCPLALQRWIDEISAELNQNILLWSSGHAVLRRSAVVFWVSLLRGYSSRLLELINGDTVRDIYRTLKLVADGDSDDMTRAHAEVGLAELDALLKGQLFAKPNIL